MSGCVLPTFSSKSFIVSSPIFRSLIHFEFIFGMVLGSIFNFILKNMERFINLCVILLQGPCLSSLCLSNFSVCAAEESTHNAFD